MFVHIHIEVKEDQKEMGITAGGSSTNEKVTLTAILLEVNAMRNITYGRRFLLTTQMQ